MTREQVIAARNNQIYDSIHAMLMKIPMAMVIALFAGGVSYVIIKMLMKKKENIKSTGIILSVSYIAFLLQLTVFSREKRKEMMIDIIPFDTPGGLHLLFIYVVANWIVFIPLGIFLMCVYEGKRSMRRIILEGIGVSVLIELTQLVFRRGLCQLEDVIVNGLGIVTGCLIYRFVKEGKKC